MNIIETITHKPCEHWEHKVNAGIFVTEKENIDKVYEYLLAQDDYWEDYKKIIKVLPESRNIADIRRMCEYCGKTDIFNVATFVADMGNMGIDVFVTQDIQY